MWVLSLYFSFSLLICEIGGTERFSTFFSNPNYVENGQQVVYFLRLMSSNMNYGKHYLFTH